VQIRSPFIPNTQATKLMQPGQRSFHYPAIDAQAAPVGCAAAGQHGLDMSVSQPPAVGIRVIATIPLQTLGTPPGTTAFTSHGWNSLHQRLQLGDVMAVSTRQADRQGDAGGIGEEVVLATEFGFIRRIGARLGPPFRARNEALSTTARDQSIWSAPCSLASRTSWSRCQTPAACQSRSRRQQVMPLPHPSSWGKSSQPIPVFSTNRMPVNARRLSIGFRPGYRYRRGLDGGKSGTMIDHNGSSITGLTMGRSFPTGV
jgi:hypothetical protein